MLLADGAARVDLEPVSRPTPPAQIVSTVMLPAHPAEVRRLIALVERLSDSALMLSIASRDYFPSPRQTLFFRWANAGREKTLRTVVYRHDDELLNFMVRETQRTAHLGLSQALQSYHAAGAWIKAEDEENATTALSIAVSRLMEWQGSFVWHYLPDVLDFGFVEREYGSGGAKVKLTGGCPTPILLMQHGIPRIEANEIFYKAWIERLHDTASMVQTDGMTVVTFNEAIANGGRTGLPTTISPETLQKLRRM
jgi:hypothetical protein